MAAIESPEKVGIRPVPRVRRGAGDVAARGPRRRRCARRPATSARASTEQGEVLAIRTIDLVSAGYPATFAFHGAARGLNPYVNILNRLVVIQFEDFEGARRTMVWEPTIPEGSAEAPFYEQLLERFGEWVVLQPADDRVPHGRAGAGRGRADARATSTSSPSTTCTCRTCASRWARPSRSPARTSRARRSSPTRSSSSSARRSTPSSRCTRRSGPGTSPAAWTT